MSTSHFTYGLASKKGSARTINCDSAIVLRWSDIPQFSGEDIGLFIVADGTGKQEEGLKASQLAVEIVSEEIKKTFSQASNFVIKQAMIEAFQEANQRVLKDTPDGGTTLTAALLVGNQVYIAHVGDSRLYYVDGSSITLMTNDHAIMSRYIEIIDPITPDTYELPPLNKVLFRAIGQSEKLDVDFRSEQVSPNTQLLLCTDGLISLDSVLTEVDLLPVITQNKPQSASDKLIEMAQERGSTDDISVIIVKTNDQ